MIVCMNAVTGGITEWDLDWLGVAEHGGAIYGVTEGALVTLDGESETGFSGTVRTGELDFGTTKDHQIPHAHLELLQTEAATFTAGVAARGETVDTDYPLAVRASDNTDNATFRVARLARFPRGGWWAFGVSGAAWALQGLGVVVKNLPRRG